MSIVELWTGEGGELTLSASIPDRSSTELRLGTEANAVAARAGAQGNAWLEIWIPEVLADRQSRTVRSIPIQHRGELFGLLVLDRDPELPSFDQREDGMLLELARQLGLALHNARLDAALRATVRELERSNAELTTSRARLVRAADESRRHIERDLHDGAQQRLVGLAIQAGLARAALESDPRTARALLDQLTVDVEDTIVELRELAHGIYPPRLRDRGLVDAIHTMTQRVGLPTTVEADRIERYAQEVEAAVYFCCSEALLNAGKHAGTGSTVAIRLSFADGTLELTVADDGVGFDNASHQGGQGITNMRDRIGALGGELRVDSAPDGGTVVHAMLPALPVTSEEDAGRGTRPAAAE